MSFEMLHMFNISIQGSVRGGDTKKGGELTPKIHTLMIMHDNSIPSFIV